jgi:citrate synthase
MTNNVKRENNVGPDSAEVTAWWATGVSRIEPGVIELRGYGIAELIEHLDFVSTIWLLTRGDLPSPAQRALFESALVASVDHGPQAPSIASARMAITCGVGINSAIANGVNVLGDAHGGAGQQCVELLTALASRVRNGEDLESVVRASLEEFTAQKLHVPGFGHRFHPIDPRRDPLLARVHEAISAGAITGEYLAVGAALESALATERAKPIPINIDGLTAIIYAELGIEPELARGMFVLSRSVGILSHAWEQRQAGQRIKGPLPPPLLADYVGHATRKLPAPGAQP